MITHVELQDRATLIMSTGRLDFEAAAAFQQELEAAIGAAAARKAAVVIDCGAIDYVSSAGLRVFLVAARAAKGAAVAFAVHSLTPSVKEVFDVSGFGRIIDVLPDLSAAMAKVGVSA